MKNVLVISNNSVSNSESNGRIHTNYVLSYIPSHLFNFYVRGNPDVEGVDYITCSNKNALLSKLSLGLIKPKLVKPVFTENDFVVSTGASNKSKYPFFHLLRDFCFHHNYSLIKKLNKYVKDNKIDIVMLWGTNIPFLYEYSYKIAKRNDVKLITFTGEDYPIKDYNYLTKHRSILYYFLAKKLYRAAKKVYKYSSLNLYASNELKSAYENEYKIYNGIVKYFSSRVTKIKAKSNEKIKTILYGGNLYEDRVNSLLDVANHILKYSNVIIEIYGNGTEEQITRLKSCKNVHYNSAIKYEVLLDKIKEADLLIHVEGFSNKYIKDCKYAFSTKISDYFMFGKPFFIYGSKEISGVNFAYNFNSNFVATNKDELEKLDKILVGSICYEVDYLTIEKTFSAEIAKDDICSKIECL